MPADVKTASKLTATDVMTAAPRSCSLFSSVLEAVMIFRDADCAAVPVVEITSPRGRSVPRLSDGGIGRCWGVTGVAWANLAVMFGAVVPMYLALVRPSMGGQIRQVFVTSAVPAVAGVVAGVAAVVASRWDGAPWATLITGALVGGVVYLALTVRWLRSALARARELRDMSAWGADA